ncbi:MAG: hypothetical protein LBI17_03305 [Rickettsiales bacterium]|jgi:hypothetical protein|nr:hypothetical protein [Rickettsiales bacterium]
MKKTFLALLAVFAFALGARADGFMATFEEIPLMDGMIEDEPFSFDTEEARIIEQYVSSSTVSREDFAKFYTQTLKSLGWNLEKKDPEFLTFRREDESLSLIFESESPLVVLFSLRPSEKQ